MAIGDNIRSVREIKGLTQKNLADLLGISQGLVGHYERGVRKPKLETLRRIADAMDVDVFVFLDKEAKEEATDLLEVVDKEKAENYIIKERLWSEPIRVLEEAERTSDMVFLNMTKSISVNDIRKELLCIFNSLPKIGKFEALYRLKELINERNDRYISSDNNLDNEEDSTMK